MRTLLLVVTMLVTSVSIGRAEAETNVRAAIAVNPLFGWFTPKISVGVSAYVAPTKRHVIRANIARYPWSSNWIPPAAFRFQTVDKQDGAIGDLGLGWMWFPRRAFDGFSIELGVLHRTTHSSEITVIDSVKEIHDTRYIAIRTLIGWNWSIRDRVFMSFHIGMSNGFLNGTETTCAYECSPPDSMPVTRRIDGAHSELEGFWRIGVAFDVI